MARGTNYSIIFGIIILGLFGSIQVAFADPYVLTSGTGEGTLTVGVDGYGVFGGLIIGPDSANALFHPVGSTAKDTTVHSGVAIRTIDQNNNEVTTFLTSGNIFGSGIPIGIQQNPTIVGTPTMGTSSFSYAQEDFLNGGNSNLGLEFDLLQTVTLTASGTTLTQTYTITNPQGNPDIDFSLFRYFDADLLFSNTDPDKDGGGRLVLDGTEILFETDVIGTSSQDNSFIGITSEGGTESSDRFEITSFPSIGSNIVSNVEPVFTLLQNKITGDTDLDEFIDGTGYDVTLGLRNEFSLAGGETAVYVTKTVFGSGPPEDVEIDPPTEEMVGGIIFPIDTVSLLIAGAQFNAFFILSILALTGAFAFGVLYYKTKRAN